MLPLQSIRVIDTTHVIAGPLATHQLCMLGAEVIKIERPEVGDVLRGMAVAPQLHGLAPSFVGLNAGKKSVCLDLQSAADQEVLHQLVASADVFVENLKPGNAARLRMDAATLHAINPKLIYCSISGWGQSGANAALGAFDHVIQAVSGMMAMQGADPGAPPVKVGFPVIDTATGQNAALAIVAAVLRRQRGDTSPITIDVSMVDSAVHLMGSAAAKYWMDHQPIARQGNRGFADSPGSDTVPCSDGWLSIGANTVQQFEVLCEVIGHPEYATAPQWLLRKPENKQAFLTGCAGPNLRAAMGQAFQTNTAAHWEQALMQRGVPCGMVRGLDDYLNGPYQNTPKVSTTIAQPIANSIRNVEVLGAGFRWSGEAPLPQAPAPTLGEHTEAVLGSLRSNKR